MAEQADSDIRIGSQLSPGVPPGAGARMTDDIGIEVENGGRDGQRAGTRKEGRKRSISISHMRSFIKREGKAATRAGKIRQIRSSRGAFKFLPVCFSNDLVHGSWWFVVGSLMSAIIPIFPLIDIYLPLFSIPEGTVLQAFGKAVTWILCIISGLFFTIGSWMYVRAFDEPMPRPLLENYYHFSTDELLASWFMLLAVVPAIPLALVYLIPFPRDYTYVLFLVAAIFAVLASSGFIYTCYPNNCGGKHVQIKYCHGFVKAIFGTDSSLLKHVESDWLACCWIMYWGTLFTTLGTYVLLLTALNDRQLFVYLTGFFNTAAFLIGSAYYVAGSYGHSHAKHEDHDHAATITDDDGSFFKGDMILSYGSFLKGDMILSSSPHKDQINSPHPNYNKSKFYKPEAILEGNESEINEDFL